MKRKLAMLLLSAIVLTSCGSVNNDNSSMNNDNANVDISEVNKNSEEKVVLSELSTDKVGYGQGVQLDDKNRPTGALEFNDKYGELGAKAIDEDNKNITLTFDQGYENGYTAKILDTLKEKNVKATFFLLKDYAERNPELVKRMIDEGHIVGNHSVTHRSMPELNEEECEKEILDMHKYIKDEFGYEMTQFRPPMGEFSEFSLGVTNNCGYETVLWSYAYADWDVDNQPEPQEALKKLNDSLHNGAIYLLHSVSSTNAEILGDFIDYAVGQGYKFK